MQKTYIGGLAEIAGSNPATGAYSYYATDNLGSPRAVYSQATALVAEFDYTPYGEAYTANDTIGITHRYTGHDWDATAALYFAPYRFYNPQIARWMSRDPLGMVDGPNVYAYVAGKTIGSRDLLGLWDDEYWNCMNSQLSNSGLSFALLAAISLLCGAMCLLGPGACVACAIGIDGGGLAGIVLAANDVCDNDCPSSPNEWPNQPGWPPPFDPEGPYGPYHF